jgi:hypothetical protein
VFLRWGVFGILGVAALIYAYNASKKLAVSHAGRAPAQQSPAAGSALPETSATRPRPVMPATDGLSPQCRLELEVAHLARLAHHDGDPFDRLLRMQKIAWQDDPKVRERLTQVAKRWYERTDTPDPPRMREEVVFDCASVKP